MTQFCAPTLNQRASYMLTSCVHRQPTQTLLPVGPVHNPGAARRNLPALPRLQGPGPLPRPTGQAWWFFCGGEVGLSSGTHRHNMVQYIISGQLSMFAHLMPSPFCRSSGTTGGARHAVPTATWGSLRRSSWPCYNG